MEPDRWQRVREIFLTALACGPAERSALLAEVCGDDPDLGAEVASLLAAHDAAEDFLAISPQEEEIAAPLTGQRIGPYRVEQRLGRGGMGVVYLAYRADREFQQRVALKVLKPGLDSEEVIRRFRTERQILAALDHPNITRLLDGGTTEQGHPYFVMEYVEGRPIDVYCREHGLTVRRRLELFLSVCSAVELAHRNLVVHRDLKPANILVTAGGTPKLLNRELSSVTLGVTILDLQPMTPDYAGPEQVRGEHVTTASDVYSLGVLLYELLTGHHPYRERASSPAEMKRLVTEEEPAKPSLAGGKPSRQLAGDLDNIVLKALRKEPGRRYASVEQLSADVRCYLEGRPVSARPGTLAYRTSKLVRRHRIGVAVAATFVVAVLGFGIAMGLQAARLARERDRAERERGRAEQVETFLTEIFEVSDPWKSSGETVTAREILDAGARKLATSLGDQPEVRADLMRTVGLIYRRLGLFDRAEPLLGSVLAERRRLFGEENPAVAESLADLGLIAAEKGDYSVAERLFREALALRRKLHGAEHAEVAESLSDVAGILWATGRLEEAETTYREVLAQRRLLFGNEHSLVAQTLNNLGIVLRTRGRYAEAEACLREALLLWRRIGGPESPHAADAANNLALVAQARGRYAEAESLLREALALRTRQLGKRHPRVAAGLNNLGYTLQAQGRFTEAEPLLREAVTLRRELLGPEHFEVTESLENLSVVALGQGHAADAERYARETLAIRRRIFGEEHSTIADAQRILALALRAEGETRAAEELLLQAVALRRKLLGNEHPEVAAALVDLSDLLTATGDFPGGESAAREALDIFGRSRPSSPSAGAEAESALGASLAGQRRFREAEPLLVRSHAILVAERGETFPATRKAHERLAGLYRSWGNTNRTQMAAVTRQND